MSASCRSSCGRTCCRRSARNSPETPALRLKRRSPVNCAPFVGSPFPEELQMALKVAINGYGRIGRNVLRALYEANRTSEIQIVAVNDLGDAATNAHLTQYDTAHG